MTEWTIAFIACIEPLANAANMELVLAVLAGQRGQALICGVQDAIANMALLNPVHLIVNIRLPKQNCTYYVTVARLDDK